jgi:RecG-like helicase
MRDLDIRGAGNMLGGEQSGFMADMVLKPTRRSWMKQYVN